MRPRAHGPRLFACSDGYVICTGRGVEVLKFHFFHLRIANRPLSHAFGPAESNGTVASSSSVTRRVLAEISNYIQIQFFIPKIIFDDEISHSMAHLPSSLYSKPKTAQTSE